MQPDWRQRWFAGLTWNGVALIVLMCLLHAMRRNTVELVTGPRDLWLRGFAQATGTGLLVALLVTLAVVATYNKAPAEPRWRYPLLAVAALLSTAVGVIVLFALETGGTFEVEEFGGLAWYFIGTWPRYALIALLLTAVFVHVRRAEDSEAARRQADLDRVLFDQQMDEARLQVLQAQIEPHFLFNTLANVRRLYHADPVAGESMLENLMHYLAVALPQMRSTDSSLGREIELAEAYLGIQQIRMGRRLTYAIDVPDALRAARLPPMMVLTLAENAIKHGLSSLTEGGFIHISARVDRDRIDLQVADSGKGFTEAPGAGTGLANIRARLAALYGTRAELRLRVNHPHGVIASIALPYTNATAAPVAVLV